MSTRRYETTVIINGTLEEKQISDASERIAEFLKKNGGEISRTDEWGRRRMAYPIGKKNQGFYVQFQYNAPGEIVALLARFCRIDDDILRELTLELSDLDIKRRDDMEVRLAEAEAAAAAAEEAGITDDEDDIDIDL